MAPAMATVPAVAPVAGIDITVPAPGVFILTEPSFNPWNTNGFPADVPPVP